MIIISDSAVAVENDSELRDALEKENTITTVYLARDITLTKGINVLNSKKQVTIDGLYPLDGTGVIHTYTDMNSSSYTSTIFVQGPSSINITLKNLNVVGRNYYGIVCVYESSNTAGVVVTYENLTYAGPQPTYHPGGLSIYIDVKITLQNNPQEVAETYRLKIGGKSTIITPSTGSSAFWFRGSGSPYLEIAEGAEVSLSTALDVIYTSNPVKITIGKNARFTVETKYGIFRNSLHQASGITVGENALFKVTQQAANGSIATLYCRGNFEIGHNSTVILTANYANAAPLIRFNTSSAALNINNPRTVLMYNKSAACLSFEQSVPVNVVCGKLDYWSAPPALNADGGIDEKPLYSWYKSGGGNLSVNATATNTQTTVTTSNLTAEEGAALPNINLLQYGAARALRFMYDGKLALLSAPARISFKPPALSSDPAILGKQDAVTIEVEDSRFVGANWFLYAYIDGELATPDKEYTLAEALVFDSGAGGYKPLSGTPSLVYTGAGNGGENFKTAIIWSETEGILLRLTQPVRVGKTYTAVIRWVLSDKEL